MFERAVEVAARAFAVTVPLPDCGMPTVNVAEASKETKVVINIAAQDETLWEQFSNDDGSTCYPFFKYHFRDFTLRGLQRGNSGLIVVKVRTGPRKEAKAAHAGTVAAF